MSVSHISVVLRRRIRERSHGLCEYCLLSEQDCFFTHEPDHIIAEKHGGETTSENLALACFDCNRFKGTDIASRDPKTKRLVPLFNPRIDVWDEHFKTRDGLILPLTPIGRATERLLKLNIPARVEVRTTLARCGCYPRTQDAS
ncbi:MAG: HNH endonuclease [Schlesneria sp.]